MIVFLPQSRPEPKRREITKDGIKYREVLDGDDEELSGWVIFPILLTTIALFLVFMVPLFVESFKYAFNDWQEMF